ncbi:hypothetical protein CRUP_033900, partial [Coryphaenoides rupestris]
APPAVKISVCFTLLSAHYKGLIDLQYSLVADLLHKPTLPNRFYFNGNRTSNQTTGRVRARHNQLTCTNHLAYQRRDTRDVFTKVLFQLSYALNESSLHRGNSRSYPPLKPLLQRSLYGNSITSQVELSFLLDVNQSSTPGDVIISIKASSDNYEHEDYMHDNAMRLVLPLRYGVDISIHG